MRVLKARLAAAALTATVAVLAIGAAASAWDNRDDSQQYSLPVGEAYGPGWHPIRIDMRTVGQDPVTGPAPLTLGPLKFAGAMVLTSPDRSFGGFSGLRFAADGTLWAISDRAKWLRARPEFDGNGALATLTGAALADLAGADGDPIGGLGADAESLELLPDGDAIIGFERFPRLDLYHRDIDDRPGFGATLAPDTLFAGLPENDSLESVASLSDGRIIALSEGGGEARPGWIGPAKDETGWSVFRYAPARDFSPTDITQDATGTGEIYVVERAFSPTKGVRARITRFPLGALAADALVEPEELARLTAFHGIDNMEGIALRRLEDGRLMLYLISDDNFSIAQRTVLMSWEVTDRKVELAPAQ